MTTVPPWKRHVALTLVSATLALLVAGAIAEAYIRLARPYSTPETLRRASLEYEATLFCRTAFPRFAQRGLVQGVAGTIQVNRRGYRGAEFSVPKPEGVTRIVVMGGSAGFDVYAPEGRDWPHLVEDALHMMGHNQIEVINASTPGHASFDSLGRLYSEIWLLEPDYVLVYHAWNDIKYFGWLSPEQSLLRGYHPAPTRDRDSSLVRNPFIYYSNPVDRFLCHSQLYVRLRTRYWSWRLGEFWLEGLVLARDHGRNVAAPYPDTFADWGPRQYELNMRLIARATQTIGALPVLLTQARLVDHDNSPADQKRIANRVVKLSHDGLVRAFQACDRAVATAADAENSALIDVGTHLTGRSEYFVDHVHTTPAGSEAIAQTVAESLHEMLPREP